MNLLAKKHLTLTEYYQLEEGTANIMDWQKVRFASVEDKKGQLVGLVSVRKLVRYLIGRADGTEDSARTVTDLMIADPITIAPHKTVMEAMRVMKKNSTACLPVVKKGKLVGIISEGNFLNVTASLLNVLGGQQVE